MKSTVRRPTRTHSCPYHSGYPGLSGARPGGTSMHRARRALVFSVVATIGLAGGVASPAFAEVFSTTPTTWAYVDSAAPQSAFVNRPGDARLGTTVGADHKAHTYRS